MKVAEPTAGEDAADVVLIKLEPEGPRASFAPPFGLLYLASALEKAGFRVRLYHDSGTGQEIERIATEVVHTRPLAVGVSSFTGPGLIPSLQVSRRIQGALGDTRHLGWHPHLDAAPPDTGQPLRRLHRYWRG